MFITFEAGEGAGKSTQARHLAEYLREQGYDVILTREPGGSPLAEELRALVLTGEPDRMDPETELLIFTAARRDHLKRTIEPALAQGKIVICDRFLGSTHALQGAAGIPPETIDTLHEMFCGRRPDLTIFLEIDAQTALKRGVARNTETGSDEGRFEAKGESFHDKVCRFFRAQYETQEEWQRIDAQGTIEEVFGKVRDLVLSHPEFPRPALGRAV